MAPFCFENKGWFTQLQCDQMKESKEAKFSPNVAPKAATSYYIQIETLLKQPKKFQDNWDIIAGKSCHQYLLKIAQSGHTIHKLHLTHVAVACDSCVSSVIGNFIIFRTVTVSYCHLCLMQLVSSVTRLGNLLDFGQVFKAFGNKYFAQISHILRQFL